MSYGRLGSISKGIAAFILLIPLSAQTARANDVVLLAFGDSLTQGYGLAAADGFVPQLEKWLKVNSGLDVKVVNGGVSGDTTAGGASRIAWSLTPEIDGVIVTLGGNDLLRGLAPEETKSNLEQIMLEISNRDLPAVLAGMEAVSNYGPEYKAAFDAIYPDVASEHDAIHYPHFLAGMMNAVDQKTATLGDLMQADGIHPNAKGVALNVAAIGPVLLELVDDVVAP